MWVVAMTGDSYLKSSVAFHVASQCKIMRHDRGAPAKLCLGGDLTFIVTVTDVIAALGAVISLPKQTCLAFNATVTG